MNTEVRAALAHGHVVDITTTGRRTGHQRRIEIVFHNIDGRLIITGMPVAERKRAWLSNLESNPHLTLHLKGSVQADVPATARVITDNPSAARSPSGSPRTRGTGRTPTR